MLDPVYDDAEVSAQPDSALRCRRDAAADVETPALIHELAPLPDGVGRDQAPSTRMGNVAGYRAAWVKALDYRAKWEDYEAGKAYSRPTHDLQMETLLGVMSP